MANSFNRTAQQVGWPAGLVTASTLQLNGTGASAAWAAFGYTPPPPAVGKTIQKLRVFISAVAGTLAATDPSWDIYSDNGNGVPNVSLGSVTLGSAPAGAGAVEFNGMSVVAANQQYWFVIKNNNANQAANNFTLRWASAAVPTMLGGGTAGSGWIFLRSANAGSTWIGGIAGVAGFRVGYSDGTYDGMLLTNAAASGTSITNAVQVGVRGTLPANVTYNVAGVSMPIRKNGSPTGAIVFNVFLGNNTSPVAGGTTNPSAEPAVVNQPHVAWFPTTIQIPGGQLVRVTAQDNLNGDAGAFLQQSEVTVDNDANSLSLGPLNGTLQKCVLSGGAWTDTQGVCYPFTLELDSNGEFTAQGAGLGSGGLRTGGRF